MSTELADHEILSIAYDLNAMPEQMTDAKLCRFARAFIKIAEEEPMQRIAQLEAENAALQKEVTNWKEGAAQYHQNANFYCGLLDKVGEHLGPEVFVSDDGSIQDEPIRLKIPDMVAALRKQVEK
jgi:hypothetical protein